MTQEPLYFDYCHTPYEPAAATKGKMCPRDLFFQTLPSKKIGLFFSSFCRSIQKAIGPHNTVWGAKYVAGRPSWELYFYNDDRKNLDVSLGRIAGAAKNFLRFKLPWREAEKLPYFMFSFNIDDNVLRSREISGVNIYLGGRDRISEGFSYLLTKKGFAFENHYDFYTPQKERDAIFSKITRSPFSGMGGQESIQKILMPELMDCHTVCLAHKKECDGVYFSRVSVDQLLFFLEHHGFSADMARFVKSNRKKLDHLRYDVAFDYKARDGRLIYPKFSYYGIF